jgi:hypothetical protein
VARDMGTYRALLPILRKASGVLTFDEDLDVLDISTPLYPEGAQVYMYIDICVHKCMHLYNHMDGYLYICIYMYFEELLEFKKVTIPLNM